MLGALPGLHLKWRIWGQTYTLHFFSNWRMCTSNKLIRENEMCNV
jgi:hypothetical protein